jgi:hypothetical protein
LKDKRHQHPGCQPLLSLVEQAQLLQTLQTPPADGGLWNSRKVAEWMSNLLERPVSVQRGWDYLRSCRRQRRSVIEFFDQAIKAMVNSAVQTPSLIPQVET